MTTRGSESGSLALAVSGSPLALDIARDRGTGISQPEPETRTDTSCMSIDCESDGVLGDSEHEPRRRAPATAQD